MTHVTSVVLAASLFLLLTAAAGCDPTASRTDASADTNGSTSPVKEPVKPSKQTPVKTETATFGAGCFWGIENKFRQTPGVVDTAVGYAGGKVENPTYRQVCEDETGHAEVVQVVFDPSKITYQQLLEIFFENHDPTTMNRQGPDVGTQYRSVIFFHGPEQQKLAQAEKAKLDASGEYVGPIVTTVDAAPTFWKAEDYHQQYFEKKGVNWSCHTGNGKKRKVSLR